MYRAVPCLAVLLAFLLNPPVRAGNGDADLSGSVTLSDAALCLRFAAGLQAPSFAQGVASDATASLHADAGRVSILDAVLIARVAAGLRAPLPAHPRTTYYSLSVSGDTAKNFELSAGYRLTGKITSGTGPVSGSVILEPPISAIPPGGIMHYTGPAVDGTYTVVAPPGSYTAMTVAETRTVDAQGRETVTRRVSAFPAQPGYFTLGSDTGGKDLSYQPSGFPYTLTWGITFEDPNPGFTPERARVMAEPMDNTTVSPNDVSAPATSTPFRVDYGSYQLSVSGSLPLSDGTVETFTPWTYVSVSQSATPVIFDIPNVYEVTGTVTAPAGSSVTGLRMYTPIPANPGYSLPDGLPPLPSATVPVGSSGAYRVAVTSADTDLEVDATTPYLETSAVYRKSITVGAPAPQDVALPAMPAFRTVSGFVVGPDGQPPVGASVVARTQATRTLTNPYPSVYGYRYTATTTVGADGRFTLHLPDGAYTLGISPQ